VNSRDISDMMWEMGMVPSFCEASRVLYISRVSAVIPDPARRSIHSRGAWPPRVRAKITRFEAVEIGSRRQVLWIPQRFRANHVPLDREPNCLIG
jgi:hypothetical protein